MKKPIKVICALFLLMLAFMLGWRVMPRIWPGIKSAVVYRIFPHLKPETVEPDPYIPHSNASLGDPLSINDSVIYYFYKDYCPYCRALEPLTAGLPDHITLPDGTTSHVKFICLNKVEEDIFQIISEYYEKNNIPEERQYVPAIVIGDRYLFLDEEIVDQLMDALIAGEGLNTPLIDGAERITN